MKRLIFSIASAAAAGCSSLQPASKYQGMDVRGVTVTLNVQGLADAEAGNAEVANDLHTTAARGVPALAIELATQSATMGGEDTHSPVQSQTISPEVEVPLK